MLPENDSVDLLRSPKAGALVIRGGMVRTGGYAVTIALAALTSVFLLRGLGVDSFGRYATVAALLAIVSTISDAGLTAIGARELSLRRTGPERDALLQDLVALRIGLTCAGVAVTLVFAVLVGYDSTIVAGVILGGVGVLLVNTQAMMMTPLSVDMRLGAITAVEITKSVTTLLGVAALAVVGASLLPYFAVQILAGVVVLAMTPKLVGSAARLRPRFQREEALVLLREAAPIAIAVAMNVLYLRLLVVMVSLTTNERETGLYGTAFRVVELFIGISPVVIGVALPLLAVAGAEDIGRLRYAVQRLLEVAIVASAGLALVVTVLAEPALRLLGGEQYVDATGLLQIQVWALIPLAASNVAVFALVSLRRQLDVALATALALVVVLTAGLALIHLYGGEGAAVAGLLAELTLLLGTFAFLARANRDAVPSFGFVWRTGIALAAGLATMLIPLPPWIDGAVAALVYGAVAFVAGAIPREIVEALRRRAPGDRE